jgi:hypothetical protein
VADETTIRLAAERIGSPLDLVVIATGVLNEDGRMAEKALRELGGGWLARWSDRKYALARLPVGGPQSCKACPPPRDREGHHLLTTHESMP